MSSRKYPVSIIYLGIVSLILFSTSSYTKAAELRTETIPYSLEIKNEPVALVVNDSMVRIEAKGKTNMFNNPNGISRVQDAPMVLFTPKGDFTLRAKVTGDLKAIYDVAALVVYQDENLWAKFCYENSVDKVPTIVTMVTRTLSDDCNNISAGSFAYMAVVRKGNEFKFLYSADNKKWQMLRHFNLDVTKPLKIGFAAHGSRGDGFTGKFTEIKYSDKALEDMHGE